MKRLLILIVAALLALGIGAAPAYAEGGDTAAVAINTKDGSSLFKLAFSIKKVMGDVVDTSNAAVAFASCTSCQTVAVSIQIVLIESDASVITPTNVAIAYNYQCTLCVTFADAMQFVFTTGGPVHFTAEGNKELARIRHDLEELRKGDLPLDQLVAALNDIHDRILKVLTTQLVPAGKSGESHQQDQPSSTTPSSTEPTATTPTSTEPTTSTDTTTTPTTTGTTTGP